MILTGRWQYLARVSPGCLPTGQAVSASYDFDPCINSGASSPQYTRPYLGYAGITDQYDEGSGNYNALQSSFKYRVGVSQFSVAYTWSKALSTVGGHGSGSTTSQSSGPQNPRDWAAEYGPPSYDFTNDISGTWVYAIPFFSHGRKPAEFSPGPLEPTGPGPAPERVCIKSWFVFIHRWTSRSSECSWKEPQDRFT